MMLSGQGRTGRMVTDGVSAGSTETELKRSLRNEEPRCRERARGSSCHLITVHTQVAVKRLS
jgi:hypothetical protein